MFTFFRNSQAGQIISIFVIVAILSISFVPGGMALAVSTLTKVGAVLGAIAAGIFLAGTPIGWFVVGTSAFIAAGAGVGGALDYFSKTTCSLGNIACHVTKAVHYFIDILIWILGSIISVIALVLDISISFSIQMLGDLARSEFVQIAWRMIRDIANMAFIFVLLYIAVKAIMGAGGAGTSKMVVILAMAALLINFSFALTRIVIDISNVAAVEIYNNITEDGKYPLSTKLLSNLGVGDLVNYKEKIPPATAGAVAATGISHLQREYYGKLAAESLLSPPLALGIATMILMVLAMLTTVIISGAILFIIRTVVLVMLLVSSPFAFLAFAIPGSLSSFAQKWAHQLFSTAFWAPVFLFLMLFTIFFVTELNKHFATNLLTGSNTAEQAMTILAVMLMYYTMVCALLVASAMAGKVMGVAGADAAVGWGRKFTGGLALAGVLTAAKLGKGVANWSGASTGADNMIKGMEARGGVSKWAGTQLRNLPYYGRDMGKAAIDRGGGTINSALGTEVIPTSKDTTLVADAFSGKSMKAYEAERAGVAKEAEEEARKVKIDRAQNEIKNSVNTVRPDSVIEGMAEGSPEERAAKADARTNNQRAKDHIATQMGELDTKGVLDLGHQAFIDNPYAASHLTAKHLEEFRKKDGVSVMEFQKLLNAKIGGDSGNISNLKQALSVLEDRDIRSMDMDTLKSATKGMDEKQATSFLKRDTGWGDTSADQRTNKLAEIEKMNNKTVAKLGHGVLGEYLNDLSPEKLMSIIHVNNTESDYHQGNYGDMKSVLVQRKAALEEEMNANGGGFLPGADPEEDARQRAKVRLYESLTAGPGKKYWGF
ncbi:MAG: hypothetical protein COV07_00870 [Candidatus Vogelbacteria bacterium CG10_big_fil_rev_8_21_14_0_10_45_14]|uniref:Uncharacterized protein n=1 Tax=Candidatus Vogelbacteria bacterium CG10_big_fil_rev_8_21_14_0_10_45_14 TaxID=1975042 RepID=A0A2H0RKT2_9BACT|nr:MAG: hypothetical protein COV07_00870 [Candidatus Vogelbacteria bacterium CG10_big_fil_rev_8_21_14_0_10_45_14]